MIKDVLFDLDDTLLDFRSAERAALRETLERFGVPATPAALDRYHEINREQWRLLERGERTRPQIKVERYRLLFAELGVSAPPDAATAYYETRLAGRSDTIPGARELLESLRGRYRLYVFSNGTGYVQRSRVRAAGLAAYFEDMFISEELGATKPDIAYFERAFARIPGFRRENAVMVGDSLTSDIAGAAGAGLAAVWYNPEGLPPPEGAAVPTRVVRLLGEVPGAIEEIGRAAS